MSTYLTAMAAQVVHQRHPVFAAYVHKLHRLDAFGKVHPCARWVAAALRAVEVLTQGCGDTLWAIADVKALDFPGTKLQQRQRLGLHVLNEACYQRVATETELAEAAHGHDGGGKSLELVVMEIEGP
jgi:hypothetical protein